MRINDGLADSSLDNHPDRRLSGNGYPRMNSPILIVIVTVLYALEAARLVYIGQNGMGLTFLGYAVANIGLIWAVMERT